MANFDRKGGGQVLIALADAAGHTIDIDPLGVYDLLNFGGPGDTILVSLDGATDPGVVPHTEVANVVAVPAFGTFPPAATKVTNRSKLLIKSAAATDAILQINLADYRRP